MLSLWVIVVVICSISWTTCAIQDMYTKLYGEVWPSYNATLLASQVQNLPVPDNVTIDYLDKNEALMYGKEVCLTNTDNPGGDGFPIKENQMIHGGHRQLEALPDHQHHLPANIQRPPSRQPPPIHHQSTHQQPAHTHQAIHQSVHPPSPQHHLSGLTYWYKEWLNVGHTFHEIVLLQVLNTHHVDRVIVQLDLCANGYCRNLGFMTSFYNACFAAVFEAFGQANVPVYVRYDRRNSLHAEFYSISSSDFRNHSLDNTLPSMSLRPTTCFEEVVKSKDGFLCKSAKVSVATMEKFRNAAYKMVNMHRAEHHHPQQNQTDRPVLTTCFPKSVDDGKSKPPYRILFATRGNTRSFNNSLEVLEKLQRAFPYPEYIIRHLDTSDPTLDSQTQIQAAAEAHVVIFTHGAFVNHVVYMRRHSFLLELTGNYIGLVAVESQRRLAIQLEVYYGRVLLEDLKDHLQKACIYSDAEIARSVEMTKEYFKLAPFRDNMCI